MEDNMQQVGSMLGNLKDMASTMGEEIDRQNRQIDKIGAKVKVCLCWLLEKTNIFRHRWQTQKSAVQPRGRTNLLENETIFYKRNFIYHLSLQ